MNEPRVLVAVADGSEEIETVTVVDVLRRAGCKVVLASAEPGRLDLTLSRGVRVVADRAVDSCAAEDWDLVVLPGGMPGARHLRDSGELTDLLRRRTAAGLPVAAICAAPEVVLHHHGLLGGRKATAHPAYAKKLPRPSEDRVVIDGPLITSRGPGTALEFALALTELLLGKERAEAIAGPMVMPGG